jgi:hypothetical protein
LLPVVLAAAAASAAGCAPVPEPHVTDLVHAMAGQSSAAPGEPADQWSQDGSSDPHVGVLLGLEFSAYAALETKVGCDMVWDMFHGQFAVSCYDARGAGSGIGGASELYVGAVTGLEHGVIDWDGTHAGVSVDVNLVPTPGPFAHFVELGVSPKVVGTGEDRDHSGRLEMNEVLWPPAAPLAFTMGLVAGANFPQLAVEQVVHSPAAFFVEVITDGRWKLNPYATFNCFQLFRLLRPDTRLVSAHASDQPCASDWPRPEHEDRECVVQFAQTGLLEPLICSLVPCTAPV